MKKKDLKNGAIVQTRDGCIYLKVDDTLIGKDGYFFLNSFNEDLTGKNYKEFDIIKVNNNVELFSSCYGAVRDFYSRYDKWTWKREEPILDEQEKQYLSDVIKPFRDRVAYIQLRHVVSNSSYQYIRIIVNSLYCSLETIELPNFKENSMYKGMMQNKKYTLKELGL